MNAIRTMRTKVGLSQAAMAKQLGVSQQAVAQWEAGKVFPRGETLVKLADVLHCTIDELCGRDPPGGKEHSA